MGWKLFSYDVSNSEQGLFSTMMHTIPVQHHMVRLVNIKTFSTLTFLYSDYKHKRKSWTFKSMCRNIWNICSRDRLLIERLIFCYKKYYCASVIHIFCWVTLNYIIENKLWKLLKHWSSCLGKVNVLDFSKKFLNAVSTYRVVL